jgi:hypothetical protein
MAPPRKNAPRRKNAIHYVDNEKFYNAICEYKSTLDEATAKGTELPRIPNYVGECILKIAEGLSIKPCFGNYSFREEMIDDGVENCILYFNDFDPQKGDKPFAYFTQVIYYAFLRRIYKEEKNRYTIYKLFQETIGMEPHLLLDGDDKHLMTSSLYDNINEFMARFERKENEKKLKRKANKEGLSKFYDED